MNRFALDYLKTWAARPRRRPLVVRGARQVGKSHLVRALAAGEFEDLLEVNLEIHPDVATLFESKDPVRISRLLAARFGRPVDPGRTLLFLDEIQAAPELLASLRYFHENMPELHVIAAGSLLDFALADHRTSMPVGRIEYLHLGPMSFEEFLLAMERPALLEVLREFSAGDDLPAALHNELLRLTREFLLVGGMPASIRARIEDGGLGESDAVRQGILSTYRSDFAKYGPRVDTRRIEKVFQKIPLLVGRKFMYSHVDREERSRDLGRALEMLCFARVAHRVRNTPANGIPLGAEADDRNFKILFLDVGLLCRACGLGALDVETAASPLTVNEGALAEQFIGQHLLHSGAFYEEPELFYWMRKKRQSNAEVDYVIQSGERVIPVEVKAGKTGTLRSLHVFLREKRADLALRFNADRPSLLSARTSLADGGNRGFRLLSLPLYLVEEAPRLCRECQG